MRLALLFVLLAAAPVAASTASAWGSSDKAAAKACLKAADLKGGAVAGAPLVFGDALAQTALLVTGTWKPQHMKGAKATMLCLYDRRTGKAEAVEAKGWGVR